MENTGFVHSNSYFTATKLRDTIKNTPCSTAAHPHVIYLLFPTNSMEQSPSWEAKMLS